MKYVVAGPVFKFILNVHGLNATEALSLIYYPDPWPGDGLISLGNGTANNGGNLHLSGSIDTGDLPIEADKNNLENDDRYEYINEDYNGAKLWLVDPEDVDFENQRMVGWNPTGYLFEHDLITFDDTSD
jgi:hypothetical protein